MSKQPKHKVVAMYDSIRDNFRNGYDGLNVHQAVGILFIMDMLEDVAQAFKLTSTQRYKVAKEILEFYNHADIIGPNGTLSFVIDCIIEIILEDEVCNSLKDILELFAPNQAMVLTEQIQFYEEDF